MAIVTRQYKIATSHGILAVEESGIGKIPVLLIHGNSFCRGVFRHQYLGTSAEYFRFIAFDLPGHGESENAPDPGRTYTLVGFADAAAELLEKMGIAEAIVVGWSLGGHIGIQMLSRFPGIRGLMTVGAPPVRFTEMALGFRKQPQSGLTGQEKLSETEVTSFVQGVIGPAAESFLYEAVGRADGRFRPILFSAARRGEGVDQRLAMETSPVPKAIVNGAEDHIIQLDFFDTVSYAHLWEGCCHRLPGLGHAPFYTGPELFNPLLKRFIGDIGV